MHGALRIHQVGAKNLAFNIGVSYKSFVETIFKKGNSVKKLFVLILLLFTSLNIYATEVSLPDETIILAQMITDPEVQKCIQQIEVEHKGRFNIWAIIRRPLDPGVVYEEGSAALAAHSTYFFRGRVGGQTYKGPDAVVVEKIGLPGRKYACKIVDQMPY